MSHRELIEFLGLSRQIEELHSQLKEKDLEVPSKTVIMG